LTANAPESSDVDFSFARFAADVDHDLADTFGNLVQRVLSFVVARYGGVVPDGPTDPDLPAKLSGLLDHLRNRHEALALRGTADAVRAIWKEANVHLVEKAPWTLVKTDPDRAAGVVRTAVNLIGICARAAWPVIPEAAEKVLAAIGDLEEVPTFPSVEHLNRIPPGRRIEHSGPLFAKLGPEWIETQKARFAYVAPFV
jgi:methionyl-tRNA synthetase